MGIPFWIPHCGPREVARFPVVVFISPTRLLGGCLVVGSAACSILPKSIAIVCKGFREWKVRLKMTPPRIAAVTTVDSLSASISLTPQSASFSLWISIKRVKAS